MSQILKTFLEKPHFIFGKVMHARLIPTINKFIYKTYYISIPLSKRNSLTIPYNKSGFWSFHDSDHGLKGKNNLEGKDLEKWARTILENYKIDKANGEIILVCMPRILGYVFNPVSFWFCFDRSEKLRAVLCEVNNTFGETHSYLCAHTDQKEIKGDEIIEAQKLFHVSPFMQRDGHYKFRFNLKDETFGVWIDYFSDKNEKRLITSLTGKREIMSSKTKMRAFWAYPLVTLKTIFLIHWQAFKIILKGISYVPKPEQINPQISAAKGLNKKD